MEKYPEISCIVVGCLCCRRGYICFFSALQVDWTKIVLGELIKLGGKNLFRMYHTFWIYEYIDFCFLLGLVLNGADFYTVVIVL